MPLAGTSANEGDTCTAWNILKEKTLDLENIELDSNVAEGGG